MPTKGDAMSQTAAETWTHGTQAIRDAKDRIVAWVGWGNGRISMRITQDEQAANIRLLAAAPAMREALAELAELIETFYGGKESAMDAGERKALKNAYAILAAIEGA